jgi:hypothetical protein
MASGFTLESRADFIQLSSKIQVNIACIFHSRDAMCGNLLVVFHLAKKFKLFHTYGGVWQGHYSMPSRAYSCQQIPRKV